MCGGEMKFEDLDCDPQLGPPTWTGWICQNCHYEIDEYDDE